MGGGLEDEDSEDQGDGPEGLEKEVRGHEGEDLVRGDDGYQGGWEDE